LKEAGTQPVANEWLNRCIRNGVSTSETPFSIETGIGSAVDDLSGNRAMAAATSSDDSGTNSVNVAPCGQRRNVGGAEPDEVDLICSTFSVKKWMDRQQKRHSLCLSFTFFLGCYEHLCLTV